MPALASDRATDPLAEESFVLLGAAVLVGRSLLDVGRRLLETKPRARGPLKAA